MVSSMQFQLTSELNATPTFTLTCTSTGGPATTVSWTVNNHTVIEDRTHNITSQITNTTTATYTHTLTVTGRLVGEYECSVSNNKPSSSSGMLSVVGKNYNHNFEDNGWMFLESPSTKFVSLLYPPTCVSLCNSH